VSVDAVRRLLAKLLNAAEEEVLLECGWSGSFTCRFEMLRRRLKPPCPPRGLCRAA
jgi:hypothetical protein